MKKLLLPTLLLILALCTSVALASEQITPAENLHLLWDIPFTATAEECKAILDEMGIETEATMQKERIRYLSVPYYSIQFMDMPVPSMIFNFGDFSSDGPLTSIEIDFVGPSDPDGQIRIDACRNVFDTLFVAYGTPTNFRCIDASTYTDIDGVSSWDDIERTIIQNPDARAEISWDNATFSFATYFDTIIFGLDYENEYGGKMPKATPTPSPTPSPTPKSFGL